VARLHGPDGYTATARCALWIVEAVLRGEHPRGFQTPARAYGPDVALEACDYTREDLEP
jgi:saccharopine dehydrogenase (NAD+, L-lysine-forming)